MIRICKQCKFIGEDTLFAKGRNYCIPCYKEKRKQYPDPSTPSDSAQDDRGGFCAKLFTPYEKSRHLRHRRNHLPFQPADRTHGRARRRTRDAQERG